MRTVSIFKNSRNQAIRIPRDMEYHNVSELEITRRGDTLILRPARPSWSSLKNIPPADADFLVKREDIIDGNRFLDDFK
jgi:antitoxin VapB